MAFAADIKALERHLELVRGLIRAARWSAPLGCHGDWWVAVSPASGQGRDASSLVSDLFCLGRWSNSYSEHFQKLRCRFRRMSPSPLFFSLFKVHLTSIYARNVHRDRSQISNMISGTEQTLNEGRSHATWMGFRLKRTRGGGGGGWDEWTERARVIV